MSIMTMSIAPPLWRSRARRRLVALLEKTILAFWRPRVLAEEGGYYLDFDRAGARLPRTVSLVGQCRMLYFFSRLSRSPFGDAFSVNAARRGFAFIQQTLRDRTYGGYFWDIRDREAGPADAPQGEAAGWWRSKHLCGQAYALFAFSEFARAFSDGDATAAAQDQFALIQKKGADPAGAYFDTLARDWAPAHAEHRSLMGTYPGTAKTSNTHLTLLEAFTAYDHVDSSPAARGALAALAALLARYGTPPAADRPNEVATGYFADYLRPSGTPRLFLGHSVKEMWYRLAALERFGRATPALCAALSRQFEYIAGFGFDRARGGLFNEAGLNGEVRDTTKYWWAQAEALLGSLILYHRCGCIDARRLFLETLDWIERYQADWKVGEWHAEIRGTKIVVAPKGGPWKTCYHTGRAMLECIDILDGRGDFGTI